ncbi:MAG: CHAT domain-containing protein [Microcoleaceae cyanobacterium]
MTLLWVITTAPGDATVPSASPAVQTVATATQTQTQTATQLLEQGRQLYTAGRLSEAKVAWQQAIQAFEREGDAVGQAWAWSYLSLVHQALGEWNAAETVMTKSLGILNQPQYRGEINLLAQALTTQGQLYRAQGKTSEALESWEQAEQAYRQAEDKVGTLGSQINQAQALRALGLYRRSRKLLTVIQADLQTQQDSLLKVKGLQSLGVTLQLLGDLAEAEQVLHRSLTVAQTLNAPSERAEILLNLGNLAKDQQHPEQALDYYQQAAAIAPTAELKLTIQLNQLRLQAKPPGIEGQPEQQPNLTSLVQSIAAGLAALPPSRTSIYKAVNFAESLMNGITSSPIQDRREAESVADHTLSQALQQARALGDVQAEATVLTQLGQLYEQTWRFSAALPLTEQALQLAQATNAAEVTAQASWQLGRLLKQKGDLEGAIAAYQVAFETLQGLRNDLVAVSPDVQFSFTETIEPVYREFVSVLLEETSFQETSGLVVSVQANLNQAQAVIEALQLAELDNFFREACLEAKPARIDEVDPAAAVIYPIILPDRLEVIVALPGKPLQHHASSVSQDTLIPILSKMRQSLHPAYSPDQRLKLYQQAYNWLIRPVQADLVQSHVKTLVFVLDSELRNLPMAALHDGQQYLLEQYGVALSPGLQLLESRPTELTKDEAITAGLSEARQGFLPLPGVEQELQQIAAEVPAQVILNQAFTTANLEETLETSPARILHLATHGQFSSVAEKTFILTWDGKINVKDFDALLRSRSTGNQTPVDLLVLSACQTAQGDRRAALGLAGIAIRSGARSTIASLWAVWDDSTTKLMVEFYKQLGQPGITKAEALRQAQLGLLNGGEYSHPVYWAPFVLVGNWL